MFLIKSDKMNISFINYNPVFSFRSEQDSWNRLGAKRTFSEQNNLTNSTGFLNKYN